MRRALISWTLVIVAWHTVASLAAELAEPERVAISGTVVDEQSQAVAGALVRGLAFADQTEATTDKHGRFVLRVLKEGAGQLVVVATDAQGARIGTFKAVWNDPPNSETLLRVRLAPSRRISVVVTDAEGKPATGVVVGAVVHFAPLVRTVTNADGRGELAVPTGADIEALYASKSGEGFDYRVVNTRRDPSFKADWLNESPVRFSLAMPQTVRIQLFDEDSNPITQTEVSLWLLNKPGEPDSFNLGGAPDEFRSTTDVSGVATFRGVPEWNVHPLIFWPRNKQYLKDRIEFDPERNPDRLVTATLQRFIPLGGRVRFADGRPAVEISVKVVGDGYKTDGFSQSVKTDQDGQFNVPIAPGLLYMVAVDDQRWAAPVIDGLIARPSVPIDGLELSLRPATRVHGRVTVGTDQAPVAGQRMFLRHQGRSLRQLEGAKLPNPENSSRWIGVSIERSTTTDEAGRYEFFVGPGKFTLGGPTQAKSEEFEIADQTEIELDFATARPEQGHLTGQVVTGNPPQSVSGARIEGKYRSQRYGGHDLRLRSSEQGHFSGERALHTTVLRAVSSDGQLAGIIEIGPDVSEVTIPIGPTASATARLIDAQSGEALPATKVRWGRRVHKGDDKAPWETAWGGIVTTDSAGRFELRGMVVGQEYELSVPRDDHTYGGLPSFRPIAAGATDLGDLRLKPPYKPPTFEERVEHELAAKVPAEKHYEDALLEAERLRQNVLVIFLKRDSALAESWFKLRLEDNPTRSALDNYQLIQLDFATDSARKLAERLGVTLEAETLPTWRFCRPSGEQPDIDAVPRLNNESLDRAAILETLARQAPEPLDARELLNNALAEAVKSNRRVIVQETATWCGPCHRLARYLEEHRSIWEKDYIWVRVDQRWRGSKDVIDPIRNGQRGGIPWYAILDSQANVLSTSNRPDGGNIGFPSEPAGIDHFLNMISSTKQRLSSQDLTALREGLVTKE